VTIVSEEVKDALLVPVTALKDLGDGQYAVMVMSSAGQLEQQMVTVGLQDASFAEITGGLQEGDVVSTGLKQAAGSSNRAEEEEPFAPMPLNEGMLPPDGGGMMAPP
jgi:multidrug efflux pump subunit AcrA (membrane-fusion protein)